MGPYDAFRTHSRTRRLRAYDYYRAGTYFVTICTKDRIPYFGAVRGGVMGLEVLGCLAHATWRAAA